MGIIIEDFPDRFGHRLDNIGVGLDRMHCDFGFLRFVACGRVFPRSNGSPIRGLVARETISCFWDVRDKRPFRRHVQFEPHIGFVPVKAIDWEPLPFIQQERAVFGNPRQDGLTAALFGIENARIFDVKNGIAIELLIA